MEWLKDKKNQPIIAAIASVVIVAVIVVLWLFVFKGPSDEEAADTAGTGMEAVSNTPPGMTPDPSALPPAATGTAPAASTAPPATSGQVAAAPMESWRNDPFMPLNYKPPTTRRVRARAPIVDLPLGALFPPAVRKSAAISLPEPPQPPRRMAGLLLNGRIFAIIESNGKSEIVQPGDTLSDRLAVVEKIERDRVILKTTSEHPRYIVVRMAAAPSIPGSAAPSTNTPGGPGSMPGSRPGPNRYGSPPVPSQGT